MTNTSKSKILDLLYGKKFTYDEMIDYDDETHSKVFKAGEIEEEFSHKIENNPELAELFEKFMQSSTVAKLAESDLYFAEGFKMGLLIGLEAGEWSARKSN
ncbi:MAG: hypothetical protein K2K39_02805 [Clostridia bacterium]|nr:hypothetical protein [Clostridia bacterium]